MNLKLHTGRMLAITTLSGFLIGSGLVTIQKGDPTVWPIAD